MIIGEADRVRNVRFTVAAKRRANPSDDTIIPLEPIACIIKHVDMRTDRICAEQIVAARSDGRRSALATIQRAEVSPLKRLGSGRRLIDITHNRMQVCRLLIGR